MTAERRARGCALLVIALLGSGCTRDTPEPRAVGFLEWERIELVADASEPIVAMPVAEGDEVAAGDLVVGLDSARIEVQIDAATATRDEAQARLDEVERGPRPERIAEARARRQGAAKVLEVRERELQRLEKLLPRKLSSPDDVDRARANLDASRADRDAATALLAELEHGSRIEDIEQARHALARTEAAVRRLQIDLARLGIRAPRAALIDSLPFEIGERPRIGEVVAVLLDGSRQYARVYVPEPIRVHVRPGDPAEIFVDGLAASVAGRVRWVARDATFTPYFALTEHDRGRLSYVAEIDLSPGTASLPAGVPVEVRFPNAAALAAQ